VQQLLDAITGAAAHIGNDRLDILGANALGRALFLLLRELCLFCSSSRSIRASKRAIRRSWRAVQLDQELDGRGRRGCARHPSAARRRRRARCGPSRGRTRGHAGRGTRSARRSGAPGRRASPTRSVRIAYVDASDNRGAGSSIGGRLRRYCNGTRFRVRLVGRRRRAAVIVVALRDGKQGHHFVRGR
jgi:hypothetical protein